MASVVVSSRVDERVRKKAEQAARAHGSTLNAIVADFLQEVAETGVVPKSKGPSANERAKRALETVIALSATLPKDAGTDIVSREDERRAARAKYEDAL